jgi:hypothetical protein
MLWHGRGITRTKSIDLKLQRFSPKGHEKPGLLDDSGTVRDLSAHVADIADTMVYGVAHVVAYLSRFMSLQPGDVISTGTPPGVGMGMKPNPVNLKARDQMELGVEGLCVQMQKMVQG